MIKLLPFVLLLAGCIAPVGATSQPIDVDVDCQIITFDKAYADPSGDHQFVSDPLFVAPGDGFWLRSAVLLPIDALSVTSDYPAVQLEVDVWSADHLSALGSLLESNTVGEAGGTGPWIPWVSIPFPDITTDPSMPLDQGGVLSVEQHKLGSKLAGRYTVEMEVCR